jgi:hypothetical protein
MKGKILDYNTETGIGIISGNDGIRYEFLGSEYLSPSPITAGQTVDFEVDPTINEVSSIYVISEARSSTSQSAIPKSASKGKGTVTDILSIFQELQKDPANGLQVALQALGDNRALNAGIALSALYLIACWAAFIKAASFTQSFVPSVSGGFNGNSLKIGFFDHVKIIFLSSLPLLGIIFILWAIKQIFRSKGKIKQFVFATGVSIAPITLLLFLIWLLGFTNFDFLALLSVFCSTTYILLLNTTLISILKLSSRNALFLVPIVLVTNTFVIRVLSSIVIR